MGKQAALNIPNGPFHPGVYVTRQGAFLFRCPICQKVVAFDDACEPCCTGPSETRDEHELTVMTRVGRR